MRVWQGKPWNQTTHMEDIFDPGQHSVVKVVDDADIQGWLKNHIWLGQLQPHLKVGCNIGCIVSTDVNFCTSNKTPWVKV